MKPFIIVVRNSVSFDISALDIPSSRFALRSSNDRSNHDSICLKASWMKFGDVLGRVSAINNEVCVKLR